VPPEASADAGLAKAMAARSAAAFVIARTA